MISSTRSRYIGSVDGKKPRTRKQFLQTLEQLGGKPGVSRYGKGPQTPGPYWHRWAGRDRGGEAGPPIR
jgi:hypothetical protein